MAEKKKQKPAAFAQEKKTFTGEIPKKANEGKGKKSAAYQPRDADTTSGHDVQRSKNTKKYQKADASGQNVQKSEGAEAGEKSKSDFMQPDSTFTEEAGEEQGRKIASDDYRHRDTYHSSQKKGRYQRREIKSRERVKQFDFEQDFQTKDTTFTEEAEPEFHGSKKLDRLQKKAEKARKKTEAARKKIPKKTEYSLERVFDEKTGRTKYVLTSVKKEKPFKPDSPVKRAAGRVGMESSNFAHSKVAEVEKENSGVEAAHKTEQSGEDVYRFFKGHYKGKTERRRAKAAKLEKKQMQKEVNFRYQKFLEENPEMQEKTIQKQLQKRLQKQRIKREYAKARRAGQTAKAAKETAAKSGNLFTAAARKIQEIASKNVSLLLAIGAFSVLLVMIMTAVSSCGAMFAGGISTTLAGSYMSVPAEIDAADLAFSELEKELQAEIDAIETTYPDYDEYRYNLASIGHDPFALISYLSAVHTEFTASEVQAEIEYLFDEMYELTLNPTEETRTRTVTKTGTHTVTDPVTGETTEEEYEYEVEEEYTVTILEVTLTAKDLNVVVAGRMNEEQREIYAFYNQTHGLTQQFYKPLDLYWYNYVSSYYGWRINPVTGQEQLHRGVDIAVPTGTTVYAAMDGTVTTATYDSYYGKAVYVNGYEFTDLTGGTLNIRLQQFDAGYEYFTISAMDNAGNMSEVYKTKNPYYKDPADTSDGNPAEQLPESATPTKPGSATGTVTEHTKTDSNGNTTSQTSPAEQKKQAMKEAAEAESGKTESTEKSGQGKEFYTIQTATEKVFYLIIDRDGEEEMVYFLTEVTENDLLNATSDNSETLPKNSAALESAIPNGESALPNNNGEQADTEGKETETEKGTEGAESTGNTEETEPEPEVKEAPNPMISYVLIGSLALIVIGAAYYFKVVRKKKEDFIEDEDEDEEDNEEYENEDEESEEDTEEDFFDEQEE